MTEPLKKCRACEGRGYFRCECWPGDCICGVGDEDCDECGGEGVIDESYDREAWYSDPSPQQVENGG